MNREVTVVKTPGIPSKKIITSIVTFARWREGCTVEGLSAGTNADMFPLSYILSKIKADRK